jgi:adenylate kinase
MRLVVLNIEVPEDEIVKRLAGRRTCPRCERIYNIYFRPPRKEGWCDADGTELMTRNDDSEE